MTVKFTCLCFLFFSVVNSVVNFQTTLPVIGVIITLPNGDILGQADSAYSGKTYYTFQKIPYAAPPVGDLRFKVLLSVIQQGNH